MSQDIDIGIAEAKRKQIGEGLSRMLADTYTLYLKTHNYHWNVTGPMFSVRIRRSQASVSARGRGCDATGIIADRFLILFPPAADGYSRDV